MTPTRTRRELRELAILIGRAATSAHGWRRTPTGAAAYSTCIASFS